jgi:nitrilase
MRAAALPPELEPHPERVTSGSDWLLRGGSAIIGPDGNYVTQPVWDEEITVTAEIDLVRTREESMTLDVTGHYHRPELFDLTVRRSGDRRCDDG